MKKLVMCLIAIIALGFSTEIKAQAVKNTPKTSKVAKNKTMPRDKQSQTLTVPGKKPSVSITEKAPASSAIQKKIKVVDNEKKVLNPKDQSVSKKVTPKVAQEKKVNVESNRLNSSGQKATVQKTTKK